MISLYFGKPGSGKSTLLTKFAIRELRKINRDNYNIFKRLFIKKSKYDYVLSNLDIIGCVRVDFNDLADYRFKNCLILLDEITLDADSRDYKSFSKGHKYFFIMHRHYRNDIILFTQVYNRFDKTIRDIVDRCYYVRKFLCFSNYLRIPNSIVIPEETGEILQGYKYPKLWERILSTKWIFRPLYYKYFDSYVSLIGKPDYDYTDNLINLT